MADDNDGIPESVPSVLKTASEEPLNKQDQDGVGSTEEEWRPDDARLTEYIDFDLLGPGGKDPFNHLINNTNHEDLTGEYKVVKIVLDPGIGQIVPENSVVLIHFTSYMSSFRGAFRELYLQDNIPKCYALGKEQLIRGLEIGIKSMALGENARIIIQPEMALRNATRMPPHTLSKVCMLFDVHLIYYFSPESFIIFDRETRDPEMFNKNLLQVNKFHHEANEQFKLKNLDNAVLNYNQALVILHKTVRKYQCEEVEVRKFLNRIYTNLSLCYLKQCAFNKVCRMGIEALRYSETISKHSTKLFFNWGKALRLLKDFAQAKKKLEFALKLEPQNKTIHGEIHKLQKDKEFHCTVQSIILKDDNNADNNERLAPEFWEVFNTHLTEFYASSDDVLTVILNKNPDDIEVVKNKASAYDLQVHVVTKAGVPTNCIAIKK